MAPFKAALLLIGVNPYVSVPEPLLAALFKASGRDKGPIPVRGTVNRAPYRQTLVRFRGEWRLYINTKMLKGSPKRIGETLAVTVALDRAERSVPAQATFLQALGGNPEAQQAFDGLAPSRQKEILRYLAALKSEQALEKNIEKALGFLTGKNRFVGRAKP